MEISRLVCLCPTDFPQSSIKELFSLSRSPPEATTTITTTTIEIVSKCLSQFLLSIACEKKNEKKKKKKKIGEGLGWGWGEDSDEK